jgi:hypothetical protein
MKVLVKIVLVALVALAGVMEYFIYEVGTAPSDEEAMRMSIAAIDRPELSIAVTLHPDYCSVQRIRRYSGWDVYCSGIPVHFYKDVTFCTSPEQCTPAPDSYFECVTYEWSIDLHGRPSNPIWSNRKVLTVSDNCHPRATREEDRTRMQALGIAAIPIRYYGRPLTPNLREWAEKKRGALTERP